MSVTRLEIAILDDDADGVDVSERGGVSMGVKWPLVIESLRNVAVRRRMERGESDGVELLASVMAISGTACVE